MSYDLSVVIPARNEMFLARTIEDLLAHTRANTQIIAVLDGAWADPPITDNERVVLIKYPESIGQRASCNVAVKAANSKYVMKVDAHCSFEDGFDVKMLTAIAGHDDWTMCPIMRNLWAFDWKCYHCGWKKYQGPTPLKCEGCGKTDRLRRKILWIGKERPQSWSYCFDPEPHFQYFNDFKKRPEAQGDLTESMSLQGSCFMMTKERYQTLNLCDEQFGSWGSQGLEVAIKTWLSGGKVIINHQTWYAHMFRTQGGDFGFPYPQSGRQAAHAKKMARELFFKNTWDKQIHPLSWLVEKFWPVKGWTDKDLLELKKFN
jgi:glycosyltransferase involved in cell wall biosynthesis